MEGILEAFSAFFNALLTGFIWLVGIILGLVILKVILQKILFNKNLNDYLTKKKKSIILVKIPSSNEQKENATEEFLKALHHVLPKKTVLSLEMVSSEQFLHFYITIPSSFKQILESQLYAQYPEAEIEEVKDFLPEFNRETAFVKLKLKKSSYYSLNTYNNLNEDLLKSLSAVLSKVDPKDRVFIQIVLKKIGSKFWERNAEAFMFKFFSKKKEEDKAQEKLSKDLYLGEIRLAYVSDSKAMAETKLHSFIGLFKILKGQNEFKKKKINFSNTVDKLFRARVFEKGYLLTPSEIATIYHFPYKGNIVSNVVNTTSKRAPAPDILPREGLVDPKDVSFIGETNYRNEKKKFGINRLDRRRHLYVIGKTGSGKSKLLELLLLADIKEGHGCCLLDPHGDLADEVTKFVPKNRIKDVVYINPADTDFPIGFNPLEPVEDYQMRQHLSTFFIAIFKKLFSHNWNPRMEHLIRYITLALLETPDSNILGITRILSDTSFRQRVIKQIKDPVVKSFWVNEFSGYNEQFSNEAIIPIVNKVGQFISNPIIRNMVGQQKNMLDFEKFMNQGKIVFINLSKGKLGDENVALLGSMFITKIQQAALARSKIPEEERRDFYFYVDEFQNFATDAFSTILSEARKYRLDLTIAHQYIAQLPEDVKATAFGNVGAIIVFGVGGDDASYLEKEFAPIFTREDLINLNTREMYIKMSVNGRLTTPFSAKTIDVPKSQFDYTHEIKDHSKMTYGRNRVTVENEIEKWTKNEAVVVTSEDQGFPEPII